MLTSHRTLIFARLILVAVGTILAHLSASAQSYLYNRSDFVTGRRPNAIVIADFNNDGRPDIAVTNFTDNTVSILLAKPDGSFGPKNDFATGVWPIALVAADFNNDKNLDVAVVNQNDGTISVLLGNGDGTLQPQTPYFVGSNPVGVVFADFNADKKTDLAVVNETDNTVSILLGMGNGTFQGQTTVAVGSFPTSIGSGDFNKDRKTDLIVSNAADGTVSVLLSKGNGTFNRVDSPSGAISAPSSSGLAVGDFNKDGKPDCVVTTNAASLFLLLGNGSGGFQAPISIPSPFAEVIQILAADFNRDGRLDIGASSSGGIAIFPGNGDGTFAAPITSPLTGSFPAIATADLNGDGRLDFVASNADVNLVDVLLGDGKGHFGTMKGIALPPTTDLPNGAVATDLNQDGKLDLIVGESGSPNGQVVALLGKGNGLFAPSIVSPLNMQGNNYIAVGDFNGDGRVDLGLLGSSGVEILMGNGDGSFQSPMDTAFGYTTQYLTIGDFNGDGKSDIAVTTNGTGIGSGPSLHIYLSNGDGTFHAGAQYTVQAYPRVMAADVNHDGKIDLIVASFGSPLLVFLGKGDGTFNTPLSGQNLTYSSQTVAGDFNGDGKVDIAVGTYFGVAFLAGNGDGTFKPAVFSNPSSNFNLILASGDFNGDGKLDLINVYNPGAVIMLGNGDGTFRSQISYGVGGSFENGLAVADYNSDGATDFVIPSIGADASYVTITSAYISTPTANLFPTTLNFGQQTLGTTSAPLSSTLSNIGNSQLSVTGVTVMGDYQIVQSCKGKIALRSNCSLQVTFTPTQIGTRKGTLTIKDNSVASPQVIHLTGVGK